MARQGFFDHTDPQGRGPEERVRIFDPDERFTYVGENIAAGYRSVQEACIGWMHSSGHRANILGRGYTHIGGGYAVGGHYVRYYVQVFARLREPEKFSDGVHGHVPALRRLGTDADLRARRLPIRISR